MHACIHTLCVCFGNTKKQYLNNIFYESRYSIVQNSSHTHVLTLQTYLKANLNRHSIAYTSFTEILVNAHLANYIYNCKKIIIT